MQDCNLVQFEREENVFGGCNVVEVLIFLTSGRASRYNFDTLQVSSIHFRFRGSMTMKPSCCFPKTPATFELLCERRGSWKWSLVCLFVDFIERIRNLSIAFVDQNDYMVT